MSRAILLVLLPVAAFADPTTYVLDAERTELLAFTKPAGLFKGASHSHVVKATKAVGKVVFDPDEPAESLISVSFPTDALVVDDPELRKREGMKAGLSEKDRKEISSSMLGPSQLDANRHPRIAFESSTVRLVGKGKAEVIGTFDIHGVKRDFMVPVKYSVKDGEFVGEGSLTVRHEDFGLEPFVAVLGTVRNAEPIRLEVKLVGRAKGPQASVTAAESGATALAAPAADGGM